MCVEDAGVSTGRVHYKAPKRQYVRWRLRKIDVLQAIYGLQKMGKYPGYRRIASEVGLSAVSTIWSHMDRLKRTGHITVFRKSQNCLQIKITDLGLAAIGVSNKATCPHCGGILA